MPSTTPSRSYRRCRWRRRWTDDGTGEPVGHSMYFFFDCRESCRKSTVNIFWRTDFRRLTAMKGATVFRLVVQDNGRSLERWRGDNWLWSVRLCESLESPSCSSLWVGAVRGIFQIIIIVTYDTAQYSRVLLLYATFRAPRLDKPVYIASYLQNHVSKSSRLIDPSKRKSKTTKPHTFIVGTTNSNLKTKTPHRVIEFNLRAPYLSGRLRSSSWNGPV